MTFSRLLRRCVGALAILLWLGITLWSASALWIDGPTLRPLAGGLALLVAALSLGLVLRLRPLLRGLAYGLVAPLIVLGWWLTIMASNDRNWMADVARPASMTLEGDILTVRNLRNFHYRSDSDYDPHWETRRYDLSTLVGVDLFLSYWGPTLIAHTVTSWEFADGSHLAVSIETRKEQGEAYSALLGFFRQFELYYVVADESDVIGVRVKHRGERVLLYRIRGLPGQARELLLDYAGHVNQLATDPTWYNALTTNCTTTIRQHVKHIGLGGTLDWRILANGHLDELLYERGAVNTRQSFPDVRAASDITARVMDTSHSADFWSRIRQGLPDRPAPPKAQ